MNYEFEMHEVVMYASLSVFFVFVFVLFACFALDELRISKRVG